MNATVSTLRTHTREDARAELRQRCVVWHGVDFFGVRGTPVPDELRRASWLEVLAWLRKWAKDELDANPAELLQVMRTVQDTTRARQLRANGLERHATDLEAAAR